MHKVILLVLLTIPLVGKSQTFKSALYADQPGVYAIANMPSLIVDRSAKWDVQFLGTQFNFYDTNNSGTSFVEKLKASMYSSNLKEFLSVEPTFAFVEAQVVLPTVSYAINKDNVVAFSASIRSLTFENTSGINLLDFFQSIRENRSFEGGLFNDFMTVYTNTWMEFGLSYARNIQITEDWSIQGGLSLRYLSGVASARFELDGISANFANSRTSNLSGQVSMIYNDNVDQIIEKNAGEIDLFSRNGYALDIGVSARWKDKLTVGFSALDMGSISYTGAKNSSTYVISSTELNAQSFSEISNVDQLADTLEAQLTADASPVTKFKTKMPFKALLFAKYKWTKRLSVAGSIRMIQPFLGLENKNDQLIWSYTIAPIYKIWKMSMTVPLSYNNYSSFRTGIGLQWRFLVLGSDNLLSYYFSDASQRAMSVYCSFRIKVGNYEKRKKDALQI